MQKINFNITIKAPIEKVYNLMLGINDKSTYEHWASAFNPTSSYDGSWDKGSKIFFVGTDSKGEVGGMVSEIIENNSPHFVSIRHNGFLKNGVEITEGVEVEKWKGSLENYTFESDYGDTNLSVELDAVDDFVDYMNQTYPKALQKLKELCEQQ